MCAFFGQRFFENSLNRKRLFKRNPRKKVGKSSALILMKVKKQAKAASKSSTRAKDRKKGRRRDDFPNKRKKRQSQQRMQRRRRRRRLVGRLSGFTIWRPSKFSERASSKTKSDTCRPTTCKCNSRVTGVPNFFQIN